MIHTCPKRRKEREKKSIHIQIAQPVHSALSPILTFLSIVGQNIPPILILGNSIPLLRPLIITQILIPSHKPPLMEIRVLARRPRKQIPRFGHVAVAARDVELFVVGEATLHALKVHAVGEGRGDDALVVCLELAVVGVDGVLGEADGVFVGVADEFADEEGVVAAVEGDP